MLCNIEAAMSYKAFVKYSILIVEMTIFYGLWNSGIQWTIQWTNSVLLILLNQQNYIVYFYILYQMIDFFSKYLCNKRDHGLSYVCLIGGGGLGLSLAARSFWGDVVVCVLLREALCCFVCAVAMNHTQWPLVALLLYLHRCGFSIVSLYCRLISTSPSLYLSPVYLSPLSLSLFLLRLSTSL